MFFPLFNPMYFLFALPALLLGMYAQYRVRSAYSRYQRVPNASRMPGRDAAQRLLTASGLHNVGVQETPGQLSDHYDPRRKMLFLSPGVSRSASVASLGIVAHEVGHAQQDSDQYVPMKIRGGLVPAVQLGSWLGPLLFLAGMLIPDIPNLSLIGLLLFSGTLVFALVTLPVELNASRRAVAMLERSGLLGATERGGVQSVLSAAALTYVAAAVQALSTILYYLFLLSGSRRRS
ncbi:MAG: zinc metallopeptidase [Anaerolineae bacterium]